MLTASEFARRPCRLALPDRASIIVLMCNRFRCENTITRLAAEYQAEVAPACETGGEVVPGVLTACLVANANNERRLYPAQFGIAPPNSETSAHPTFDHSHTAIEEPNKWPWLEVIETSRCVVPTSEFHIGSYWGDLEGTEIYFRRADQQLLHAVGVYRIWNSPTGDQELHTFSLLTRPASDYVMDHGSDRQPIFLDPSGIDAWIHPQHVSREEAVQVLRQHSSDPELTHRHHCNLPAGWRKHQKQMTRRRGQTMAAQDRCRHECGF